LRRISVHGNSSKLFVSIIFLSLALAGIAAGTVACSKKPVEKRVAMTGKVLAIDDGSQSATIDANAIPGFMDAMAMEYKVKSPTEFKQLRVGDAVSADVVISGQDYWLENVRVTGHSTPPEKSDSSNFHMPTAGEEVPDFHFTNQDSKRIDLKQYRGKILLMTFIYTRCPFPDYCPRVSHNFAEIYHQLGSDPALAAKVRLLSVSFDTANDTPHVLRDYGFSVSGEKKASLFKQWEFAVPKEKDLPEIAHYFAVTYKAEGATITHSLSTAVIGPDGKIVTWYHGVDWTPDTLMKDIRQAAEGESGNKPA